MISKCVKLSSWDGIYSVFELALLDDVVLNCAYAVMQLECFGVERHPMPRH